MKKVSIIVILVFCFMMSMAFVCSAAIVDYMKNGGFENGNIDYYNPNDFKTSGDFTYSLNSDSAYVRNGQYSIRLNMATALNNENKSMVVKVYEPFSGFKVQPGITYTMTYYVYPTHDMVMRNAAWGISGFSAQTANVKANQWNKVEWIVTPNALNSSSSQPLIQVNTAPAGSSVYIDDISFTADDVNWSSHFGFELASGATNDSSYVGVTSESIEDVVKLPFPGSISASMISDSMGTPVGDASKKFVVLAAYDKNTKLTNIAYGDVTFDNKIVLGNLSLNPGDKVKAFSLTSLNELKPLDKAVVMVQEESYIADFSSGKNEFFYAPSSGITYAAVDGALSCTKNANWGGMQNVMNLSRLSRDNNYKITFKYKTIASATAADTTLLISPRYSGEKTADTAFSQEELLIKYIDYTESWQNYEFIALCKDGKISNGNKVFPSELRISMNGNGNIGCGIIIDDLKIEVLEDEAVTNE